MNRLSYLPLHKNGPHSVFDSWNSCLLFKLAQLCVDVHVCAVRTHARRCSAATAAKAAANCSSKQHKKFHGEATPARCAGAGHNPPSSCYQKGLNRTIAATELFGDSGTMCPKQVGNKRDEESVFFPLNSIAQWNKGAFEAQLLIIVLHHNREDVAITAHTWLQQWRENIPVTVSRAQPARKKLIQ